MPVIKITKADILRSQVMESQWASFAITSATGPTKSSKGDSWNYTVVFTLVDHKTTDLNGKEFKQTFNTKMIFTIVPLVAAVRNVDVQTIKDDFDFDLDELVGKKVDGKISTDVFDGRPINKVEEFLPYGKGVNMQPAF